MINPNWPKWIQRSILKQFVTGLAGHTVLAETQNVNKDNLDHWFEVRIDIKFRQLQGNSYKAIVDVNILVIGAKKDNIYTCKILTGLAASVFGDISILDDSDNRVFCLCPEGDIIDTYYGETELQANIEQATVEGTLETIILT